MAEPLNATFFAFRKREKGGVLMGASIGYAIAMILLLLAVGAAVWALLGGSEFGVWYGEVMRAAATGAAEPPPTPPNLGGIFIVFPLYLVFLVLLFILLAAYESACLRWMIREEPSAPFNLHFGADMWRVYGTYWAWLLYVVLGWVAFTIVIFIAGMIGGAAQGGAGIWIGFAVCVGYFLMWFYTTVRLSPASATSIGVGQFSPLKAWTASSGRFWALFGAYLLLWIVYVIVICLASALMLGGFYATLFSQLDLSTMQSDPEGFLRAYEQASMQALQTLWGSPASIALYVGSQVVLWAVGLTFYVLFFGIQARTVQAALEEGKIERAPAAA